MKAKFSTNPVRAKLARALKTKPVVAAVAYVSDVSGFPMGSGDMLVCDASDEVARSGGTQRAALQTLIDAGVSVWSLANMHAKVVVCGNRLIIGSANWSRAAEDTNIEAFVELAEPLLVNSAIAFVKDLLKLNALPVDEDFLKKMPDPVPHTSSPAFSPDSKIRHWLVSTGELPNTSEWRSAESKLESFRTDFESYGESDWLIYRDNHAVAARVFGGDRMTTIWKPDDGEVQVYPPCVVLRKAAISGFIGILRLRSQSEEEQKVPWSVFREAAIRAGVRRNVAASSDLEFRDVSAAALDEWWSKRIS